MRHAAGLETSYNHLSRQRAAVGDRVAAGEVVAWSGSTGMSTGCHLHFMVIKDGRPTDPMESL
ncbi:M23 family metallopeptidase [Aeromicrobium sp. UC242_57]|uniref:M23 family metallopeptidase n=1 Tax=Aeromicrobium sp. UC242_57 TaxID=3374624 RepID=UPI00379B96D1